jgi:hypothetical protein
LYFQPGSTRSVHVRAAYQLSTQLHMQSALSLQMRHIITHCSPCCRWCHWCAVLAGRARSWQRWTVAAQCQKRCCWGRPQGRSQSSRSQRGLRVHASGTPVWVLQSGRSVSKATLEPAHGSAGNVQSIRNAPAHVLSGLLERPEGRAMHAALPTSQQQVRPVPGAVQTARLLMVVQPWASAPKGSRPVAAKAGDEACAEPWSSAAECCVLPPTIIHQATHRAVPVPAGLAPHARL